MKMKPLIVALVGLSFILSSSAIFSYELSDDDNSNYIATTDENGTSSYKAIKSASKNKKAHGGKKAKSGKKSKSWAADDDVKVKSAFASNRPATGRAVFIFDPKIRRWAVYNSSGSLIKTGRGSGGQNYCRDLHRACHTPVGTFRVYAREGSGCVSTKFPIGRGGAPMPYCNYFKGGMAVHGSYEVRSYNASHGCIRIPPSDAKWLQSVLPIGSTVIVRPY